MKKKSKPSADELRNILWESIQGLRQKKTTTELANSIAYNAREYMRVIREQRIIAQLTQSLPSKDFLDFYDVPAEKRLTGSVSKE